MNKIDGLHHLAIATADMKEQIEFFTDKLGMELVALYWMHGVPNTWHGFLRLNDESSVAFVCNPDIGKVPVKLGETHAGNAGGNCARGTMQHVALRVKNHDELLAMRDRLRAKGVPVIGPMDHGFCRLHLFRRPREPDPGAVVLGEAHRPGGLDRSGGGGIGGHHRRRTGPLQAARRFLRPGRRRAPARHRQPRAAPHQLPGRALRKDARRPPTRGSGTWWTTSRRSRLRRLELPGRVPGWNPELSGRSGLTALGRSVAGVDR